DVHGRDCGMGRVPQAQCMLEIQLAHGSQDGSVAVLLGAVALSAAVMSRHRKPDPSIPVFIDQRKLPVGCYWNRRDRYWYALPGGKRKRLAGPGPAIGPARGDGDVARR